MVVRAGNTRRPTSRSASGASGGLFVTLTQPPAYTTSATPPVAGYVTDPKGGSVSGLTISIYVNGVLDGTTTTDGAGNFTYTINTPFPSDGYYTITAGVAYQAISNNISVDFILAETDAWRTAMIARGSTPSSALVLQIDDFYRTMKSDGSLALFDVFNVMAMPDATLATGDLIAPASRTLSPLNSPTFTADRGYTGNGSSMHLVYSPAYAPNAGGLKYTQNDCCLLIVAFADAPNGTYQYGETAGSGIAKIRSRAGANSAVAMSVSSGTAESGAVALPKVVMGVRRNSTQQLLYRDGMLNVTGTVTSTGLPTAFSVLRCSGYTAGGLSVVASGAAPSDSQIVTITNAVRTLLQARGVPIP